MPAAAVVPALIGAGASIAGGAIAAHGAKQAAQTQADVAQQAMAYTQGNTNRALDYIMGNQGQATKPVINPVINTVPGGSPAYAAMSQHLGIPVQVPRVATAQTVNPTQSVMGGPPQTVTLQAPNGQTKQFRADDPAIQGFLDRGAKRV